MLEIEQGIQTGGDLKLTGANVPVVESFADGLGDELVAGLVVAQRSLGAAHFRDVFIGRRQATIG